MKWNETSIYFDSYIYMNFRNEFAKHAEAGAEVYDCLHVYVHQMVSDKEIVTCKSDIF